METALLTAVPVLLGSMVGGTATIVTAWITQRTQTRQQQFLRDLRKREALYGEFISECSKLAIDSLAHGMENPGTLWAAYALLNRIRLSASKAVLDEAEKVLRQITDQYYAPNLSADEFHTLALSRDGDPLSRFGETCRAELKSMRTR